MLNYYNTGVTAELGDIIDSGVNLWDFEYPIPRPTITYNGKTCTVDFDRERLQKKIEDHYRFRQIGFETVGRFLHYLKTRMCEIMPYYVQLYEFDAKFRNIEDPLESYNLIETFEEETKGAGKTTSETSESSDGLSKFSDTPQTSVENLESYLTNATKIENSGNGEASAESESSGTTSHTLSRRGNIGVQPLGGEVQNIRSAFINIDLQIINELNDLFLKVY